jgi:hypothetical protein
MPYLNNRMPISNAPTESECRNAILLGEPIDIPYVFQRCCATGNLSTAKWLLSDYNVDPHSNSEYAFRMACTNGYLEVAQWLYTFNPNIRIEKDFSFRWACKHGFKHVADWLTTLLPQYSYTMNEYKMLTYIILD